MNVDHELSVPVSKRTRTRLSPGRNSACRTLKWGLKNPSVMFLRVNDHVDIEIHSVGRSATTLKASQ
jgi:hypothetical protein